MKTSSDVAQMTRLILKAGKDARREIQPMAEAALTQAVQWPLTCTVGPGLEGAIACESKVGYVNGSQGWLIYRGYDIFDLAAHSTFEEVSYLLMHGELPTPSQLASHEDQLRQARRLPKTLAMMQRFDVTDMHPMALLRLGTNVMRQEFTWSDKSQGRPDGTAIASDEDSIAMETRPQGFDRPVYEFPRKPLRRPGAVDIGLHHAACQDSSYHLIAGVASIAAAINRMRRGLKPVEPDDKLSHAANLLYMMKGRRPTAAAAKAMDVALILHADHGMNASTFAALVVASTLSDMYFAVGAGIGALSGPLHGGANEQVIHMLREIGSPQNVAPWLKSTLDAKRKIMGFGHRVYKAYDPRARVLAPLVAFLADGRPRCGKLLATAARLEKMVLGSVGKEKNLFPNVDFYSGLLYRCLAIEPDMFTPLFAVSRVAGWSARILEYLQSNRIFRPRAIYSGPLDRQYTPRP
ncbi:MAG: citrate/2-methylcitrate synthase [Planctomycetaceae bacterium]|nr:citrate/2-methylcitrate synthase [Planctomycetaceae bacterium]